MLNYSIYSLNIFLNVEPHWLNLFKTKIQENNYLILQLISPIKAFISYCQADSIIILRAILRHDLLCCGKNGCFRGGRY